MLNDKSRKTKRAERCVMWKFDSGELLQERRDADQAYGHGRDVEVMSVRERAMLRAWSNNIA